MNFYWVTIERPRIKNWRGHKVPFILQVRLHYVKKFSAGSKIWFNLWGPNITKWCKEHIKPIRG